MMIILEQNLYLATFTDFEYFKTPNELLYAEKGRMLFEGKFKRGNAFLVSEFIKLPLNVHYNKQFLCKHSLK